MIVRPKSKIVIFAAGVGDSYSVAAVYDQQAGRKVVVSDVKAMVLSELYAGWLLAALPEQRSDYAKAHDQQANQQWNDFIFHAVSISRYCLSS